MNIGELLVRIGAIGDSKKVKDFQKAVRDAGKAIENFDKKTDNSGEKAKVWGKKIGGALTVLGSAVGIISSTYIALDKLTSSLTEQNLRWINLAKQTNIAIETFQKWDNIGKVSGVRDLSNQVADLEQKIYKARLLGEGYEGWALAGIMPNNVEGVMKQLRQRVKGLDDTQSKFLLEKMGLDPQLINVLRMESEEIAEIQRVTNLYSLKGDERKEIERLRQQIELTRIKFQYFKDKIILKLLPIFAKFSNSIANIIEMFGKLLNKLKPLIKFFAIFSFNAQATKTIINEIGGALSNLINKIPIFGRLFGGLSRVFARVLFPLTALFLILDDIAMYMQGGDSLIGRIIDWGKEQGKGFGDAFSKIFGGDILGGTFDLLSQTLDALIDILKSIDKALTGILNFFTMGLFGWLKGKLNTNLEDVVQNVTGKTVDEINSGISQDVTGDYSGQSTMADKPASLSPTAKGQLWTNKSYNTNKTAYNTLNQTNYIQTTEPMTELESSLLFFKQHALT